MNSRTRPARGIASAARRPLRGFGHAGPGGADRVAGPGRPRGRGVLHPLHARPRGAAPGVRRPGPRPVDRHRRPRARAGGPRPRPRTSPRRGPWWLSGGRRSRFLPWAAAAAVVAAAVGYAAVGIVTGLSPVAIDRARPPGPAVRAYPKVGFADGLAMVVKLQGVEWEPRRRAVPVGGGPRAGVGPPPVPLGARHAGDAHRGRARGGGAGRPGVRVVRQGPLPPGQAPGQGPARGRGVRRLGAGLGDARPGDRVRHERLARRQDAGQGLRGPGRGGRAERGGDVPPEPDAEGQEPGVRDRPPMPVSSKRDSGPEDFVTPSTLLAPPLVLDPGYKDAVLESRPWGYWRFESLDGGTTPNEVAGRPPLRVNGEIGLSDPGRRQPERRLRAARGRRPVPVARRDGGAGEPPRVCGGALVPGRGHQPRGPREHDRAEGHRQPSVPPRTDVARPADVAPARLGPVPAPLRRRAPKGGTTSIPTACTSLTTGTTSSGR